MACCQSKAADCGMNLPGGVDVGAKAMIHEILRRLADSGMAVWMISSELPEILGVSDKVIVMHEANARPYWRMTI